MKTDQTTPTRPILTHVVPKTNYSRNNDRGWGNGYIGVPPGHPWHGREYNFVNATVHGGLTFSDNYKPGTPHDYHSPDEQGYWWLGFDTAHWGDDSTTCPESYVREETKQLAAQATQAQANAVTLA